MKNLIIIFFDYEMLRVIECVLSGSDILNSIVVSFLSIPAKLRRLLAEQPSVTCAIIGVIVRTRLKIGGGLGLPTYRASEASYDLGQEFELLRRLHSSRVRVTGVEQEAREGGQCFKADSSRKSFLFTLKNLHNVPARRFGLRVEKKDQESIVIPPTVHTFATLVFPTTATQTAAFTLKALAIDRTQFY
jgi:hypothetical protein